LLKVLRRHGSRLAPEDVAWNPAAAALRPGHEVSFLGAVLVDTHA